MASSQVLPVSPSRLPCSTSGPAPSATTILHRKILESANRGDRGCSSLHSSPQHQPQIGFRVRAKYDVTPPPAQCRAVARLVSTPGATPSGGGDGGVSNGSALRRLPLLGQKLLKHRLSEPMLLPELKTIKEPVSVDIVGGSTQECELIIPGRHPAAANNAKQQLTALPTMKSAPGIRITSPDSTAAESIIGQDSVNNSDNYMTSTSSFSGVEQSETDATSGKLMAPGEKKSAAVAETSNEPLEKLVKALQKRCKEQQAAIFTLKLKSQASASELEQYKRRRGSELLHLSAQLYWLESNLRKEQQRLKWKVESRDRTIHMQHRTIHQLTQQLKDKQNSRSCSSCSVRAMSSGITASSETIQIEIIDTSSSKSPSGDKNITDDDSAVVMDEDCPGDCTTGSTSSSGSSTSSRDTSFLPRVPPSIMRSVSDALECACIQNYDARRHSSPSYVSDSSRTSASNYSGSSSNYTSASSTVSSAVRRGSLKHNLDHPFNSYLRKPEVLETVYSVDEETEDAEGANGQEHAKEQLQKQPHGSASSNDVSKPPSTHRQNSAGPSSCPTKGPVATSNGGYRRTISDNGAPFDSLLLARSDSCDWSLKSAASSSRSAHPGRSHSSSPAVALMNRLRPKNRYFGSCDNVALAMMSERMSSYKPKSMENLMNAVDSVLPMLNDSSSTADCLLYRYQVFDRFSGISTPPTSGSTLTLTPEHEADDDSGKKSLVSDVEAASTAAAILLRQQQQDEEELHQVGIYYPGKSSGIPRNTHKNVTKPKDLKNKRNGANLTVGHPAPSRSKSVEDVRFKFWDWMGLRRHRQN